MLPVPCCCLSVLFKICGAVQDLCLILQLAGILPCPSPALILALSA
jgi:hypothetical protein